MAYITHDVTQSITKQRKVLATSHDSLVKVALATFPHEIKPLAQNFSLFASEGVTS